jgi:hypothetical protein
MEQFARPGDFCPNQKCPAYSRPATDQNSSQLRKFGKTKGGVQRYQCKSCGQTFTATSGTLFYRKRTAEKEILERLALLAKGSRISSIARVKWLAVRFYAETPLPHKFLVAVYRSPGSMTRRRMFSIWPWASRALLWASTLAKGSSCAMTRPLFRGVTHAHSQMKNATIGSTPC